MIDNCDNAEDTEKATHVLERSCVGNEDKQSKF